MNGDLLTMPISTLVSVLMRVQSVRAGDQWDQSTLEQTIKQCGGYGKGPGDNLEACAPLAPTVDTSKSRECRYEGKIPNE